MFFVKPFLLLWKFVSKFYFILFFSLSATPSAYGSSLTRNLIRAVVVNYATAVATAGSLTHCVTVGTPFCLLVWLFVFIVIIYKLFGLTFSFSSVLLLCVNVCGLPHSSISYSFLYISYHPYETWSGFFDFCTKKIKTCPSPPSGNMAMFSLVPTTWLFSLVSLCGFFSESPSGRTFLSCVEATHSLYLW